MKPCYKENRTIHEQNIRGIWRIIIVRDVSLYSPANWAEKRGAVSTLSFSLWLVAHAPSVGRCIPFLTLSRAAILEHVLKII
jgi:hypothetical protein